MKPDRERLKESFGKLVDGCDVDVFNAIRYDVLAISELIDSALAEPDADVAEAIGDICSQGMRYTKGLQPKTIETILTALRQYQKPTDEAVRLCSTCIGCECEPELGETVKDCKAYVKREPSDIDDAIGAMTNNPLYNADIRKTILQALRQMRSEPCESKPCKLQESYEGE